MLGKKLSPILVEIEETIWEKEATSPEPMEYTPEGRSAAIKIFMSVILDALWEKLEKEKSSREQREQIAEDVGNSLRLFVKQYTGIDTTTLYGKRKTGSPT